VFIVFSFTPYLAVPCPSLTDPNNGVMTCSLGDDGVTSYKDTCSFTCNTGYKLSSSDTRTCQSDGSWSGSKTICSEGEIFLCCFMLFVSFHLMIFSTTTR